MRSLSGMLKKASRFQINMRGNRCIGFSISNIQSVKLVNDAVRSPYLGSADETKIAVEKRAQVVRDQAVLSAHSALC
jgi:hypothetical protein